MTDQNSSQTEYGCPETGRFLRLWGLDIVPDGRDRFYFDQQDCLNYAGQVCRASCNYPFLFDWHYDLMNGIGSEFGFNPVSKTDYRDDGSYVTTTTVVTKGLLTSEDRSMAIFHFALSDHALPGGWAKMIAQRVNVSHTFEGEQYLLVRFQDKILSYDIEKFEIAKQIIKSFDIHLPTFIDDIGVDLESKILTIKSNWFWIGIAPLSGNNFDEEERVRLSNRLAEARPFFEFKAPISIYWNKLREPRDDNFQELCRRLLLKEPGVQDIISVGKTRAADRGRDLEVHQIPEQLLGRKVMKWLVQCKFSGKSVSPDTIKGWTDRVREHGYDGFWLMTNNDITPDLFDQFQGVQRNTDIKVRFWQKGDFQIKLNVYAELLKGGDLFDQ